MKIWIDADACPRVIKEIVFRASERLDLPVVLVANKSLAKHDTRLIESIKSVCFPFPTPHPRRCA